tara:strand:- start:211 stop:456 length:246 start_codon:yes stop_codon:yes gene_type:complete
MGYKFDGTKLKDGGTTLFNIRGDKVCNGTGSTTVANVRGDKLCKGTGSSTWQKMSVIEKEIQGHTSSAIRAALWMSIHRNF